MSILHKFYCSKEWRELVYLLKLKSGGKCNRCPSIYHDTSKLIGHHTIELTESNVSNVNISLNPELIEVICFDCHNKDHRRFGHKKKVYLVWGSPMAGKLELVKQVMRYGDIVVDFDSLWEAVTMQPRFNTPDNCRFNIFALRDNLIEQIKMRSGQWYDAYIIGGYPNNNERERLARELGAELIYCESTKQGCYQTGTERKAPQEMKKYIDEWWETYERYQNAINAPPVT